ncbi:type II toxin-antitoxin system RelE/ParE family toxin [Promineifilum sp.]
MRVGDYRVLYRIERQEVASIVVEFVRHRREVYK